MTGQHFCCFSMSRNNSSFLRFSVRYIMVKNLVHAQSADNKLSFPPRANNGTRLVCIIVSLHSSFDSLVVAFISENATGSGLIKGGTYTFSPWTYYVHTSFMHTPKIKEAQKTALEKSLLFMYHNSFHVECQLASLVKIISKDFVVDTYKKSSMSLKLSCCLENVRERILDAHSSFLDFIRHNP